MCREFMRGSCKRAESECRFAHPQESVSSHEDGSVTVCMDAVKGRCAREPCRYFHPPLHLQAQIKAAQTRATAVWLYYFNPLPKITKNLQKTWQNIFLFFRFTASVFPFVFFFLLFRLCFCCFIYYYYFNYYYHFSYRSLVNLLFWFSIVNPNVFIEFTELVNKRFNFQSFATKFIHNIPIRWAKIPTPFTFLMYEFILTFFFLFFYDFYEFVPF